MTKNVKIAIAIGSGLAVGFGGWYLYQYIQKRNEAKKLAGSTQPDAVKPAPSIQLAPNATEQSLAGAKPKKPIIKISPDATTQSLASQTKSGFNGQEMVTRYQRPFWTVGG